jgi:prenyltransferase beta subunit
VQDERIGPALKKAVDLILTSQEKNRFKAWRYSPDAQDADSTVSGACFVALVAARNAGLRVPDNAIEGALKFYTDCLSPNDGTIGYLPGSGSHGGTTTAIGVAVYAYARKKDQPTFLKALKSLKTTDAQSGSSYPFYYEYYSSQAFFQGDFKAWEEWNERRVKALMETQGEDGSWEGSLGQPLSTAFALLSIALNYRYLPIYER